MASGRLWPSSLPLHGSGLPPHVHQEHIAENVVQHLVRDNKHLLAQLVLEERLRVEQDAEPVRRGDRDVAAENDRQLAVGEIGEERRVDHEPRPAQLDLVEPRAGRLQHVGGSALHQRFQIRHSRPLLYG
jgi:signal transduction histidine kinase